MGHIERRVWSGKVSYRARYRDPAGHERSKSFDRKADAERWLAEIEHAKARGLWTDPRLRNLSTLLRCRAGLFTEWSPVSTRVG